MISNLVGTRIREIRTVRKLTQQQLAERAGIPRATLASVERDDSNPTLSVVHKVAVALGVTIDDLVESQRRRVQVVPRERMRRVESQDGVYRALTTSPENVHTFTQQDFRLQALSGYDGKPHPPGSEEYLYILSGAVVLDVAGEQVALGEGDAARFRGNVAHRYENPGEKEARGVVTIVLRGRR